MVAALRDPEDAELRTEIPSPTLSPIELVKPVMSQSGSTYRAVDVVGSPFQLTFYNTTPNAYKLAIRMGTPRSGSIRRWVWEANRSRPVRENATLTFGADGNLILADADGLSRLRVLTLSQSRLHGTIPRELGGGGLSKLEELGAEPSPRRGRRRARRQRVEIGRAHV